MAYISRFITDRIYAEYSESDTARESLRRLVHAADAVDQLEAMRKQRDPHVTEAAHARNVAKAAEKLAARKEKVFSEVRESIEKGRDKIKGQINREAGLVPTDKAQEIRAILRDMKHTDRVKTLQKAAQDGDAETLAAIADASEILTGVSPSVRDRMVEMHQKIRSPELFKEMGLVDGFEESLETIERHFDKAIAEAVDPQERAKAEQAAAAASEANSKFESSLSSF